MVYNYVNFINIIYDKELLALNYSKLNAFMLIYCGLYIIYNIIYFITFEVYFSYISHTFNNKFSSFEVKSMIKDFLYGSIYSPSTQFFNLCVSWNINGQNTEKGDDIRYFNEIFKPICICLQEVGNS